VRELAVGGSDLIRRLGLTAGPAVGRLLDKLLREVAYGRLPNEREALLEQAETWNKNRGD
jgi:tRNA nucleotidyltransferase (CCA-adding enzyme)